MLVFPSGPFIRPHPQLWRITFGELHLLYFQSGPVSCPRSNGRRDACVYNDDTYSCVLSHGSPNTCYPPPHRPPPFFALPFLFSPDSLSGVGVLYEIFLLFILFQSRSDARFSFKFFDSSLDQKLVVCFYCLKSSCLLFCLGSSPLPFADLTLAVQLTGLGNHNKLFFTPQEKEYAKNCDFTWEAISSNVFDIFFLSHFLGWFAKSLILR